MRARIAIPTIVAVVLLLLITGSNTTFGGDKDPPAVATAAIATTNTTTSPSPVQAVKWRARPELHAVFFFSKKAEKGPLATLHSLYRLKHASIGMREAKKRVEEGGLGLDPTGTGFLNIEEDWSQFVNGLMLPATVAGGSLEDRRAEAELEAEALRPFLYRGGTILVIVSEDKDDKWVMPYGPISLATDVSVQIKLAIIEHDRLKDKQANLGSTQPVPGAIASATQSTVVKTASATTDPGGQR